MSESAGAAIPFTFRPKTGTLAAWNAAYVRVEDYLRAHRIHNRLHQLRIIQKVLERAAARHAVSPAQEPTILAAGEMESLMDEWFGDLLEQSDQPHDRLAVEGRVALMLCDGPQRWPEAMLNEEEEPPDFVQAMRTISIQAGPDMAVSSMVARPIDLGPISEAAGETLERFERLAFLPTLLLWTIFIGVLAAIFKLTR